MSRRQKRATTVPQALDPAPSMPAFGMSASLHRLLSATVRPVLAVDQPRNPDDRAGSQPAARRRRSPMKGARLMCRIEKRAWAKGCHSRDDHSTPSVPPPVVGPLIRQELPRLARCPRLHHHLDWQVTRTLRKSQDGNVHGGHARQVRCRSILPPPFPRARIPRCITTL